MPHVIIKMVSGRSDDKKQALAKALTDAVISALGVTADSISVAIEDIEASEWTDKVYVPDIQGRPEDIFKQPGYDPFK